MAYWQTLRHRVILFTCASMTGIIFACVWHKYEQVLRLNLVYNRYSPGPENFERLYELWLDNLGLCRQAIDQEDLTYETLDKSLLQENNFLYINVPILCIIFTSKAKKAKAIKETWAMHCNKVVFYGVYDDEVVPVSRLPNTSPWPMLCGGLLRAWKTYRHTFKWAMIADDDTYVIADNLRYLVAPFNESEPFYVGHSMRDSDGPLYNAAEAGYALNHNAMEMLFAQHVRDDDTCDLFSSYCSSEDCVLGRLLHQLGVNPIDTRDNLGRGRFNVDNVENMLIPGSISIFSNYWRDSVYLSNEGAECCSDYTITFHHISYTKMYLLEYMVYHLRPFIRGGSQGSVTVPPSHDIQTGTNSAILKIIGKAVVQDLGQYAKAKTKKVQRLKAKLGKQNYSKSTGIASN